MRAHSPAISLCIRAGEERHVERRIEARPEAIRDCLVEFEPRLTERFKRQRRPPAGRLHPDEMVMRIGGRRNWGWRIVDGNDTEGVVLDMLV